jgi:uncharacterized membrane protein YjdF
MNHMRSIERANLMSLLALFMFVQPLMYAADDHDWSPLAHVAIGVWGFVVLIGVKFAIVDLDEWRAARAAGKRRRAAWRAERAARWRARSAQRRSTR